MTPGITDVYACLFLPTSSFWGQDTAFVRVFGESRYPFVIFYFFPIGVWGLIAQQG